jgi:SAM-dependent methyltransferase
VVRLRAAVSGEPLLPEALSDCAGLGHAPFVETSLRLFASPDFQKHALPRIRGAILVHAVPAAGGRALLARLLSLSAEAFSTVTSIRLVLSPEARASARVALAALPEAQALLRLFADRRVTVVPPPELAPRLQADFGPRARDAKRYQETLCVDHAPPAWVPDTLQQALVDQARVVPGERPLVVDFGCGVAVALLGLAAIAARSGIEVDALGLDRGYDGLLNGDPFPLDEERMRRILARHAARIGELGSARLPSIWRGNLERDPWPLADGTVALAVSRTAVMYLSDKLGLLERVYRSLREGGVALIHLDELQPGTRRLRRIRLPLASIDDLLAEQRSRGVEIHGQGNFVIAMRRSATPLVFPWKLERAYPTEELLGPEEPWGTVAHYERHGPPPDGIYRNVTVEGRAVHLIRVKEGGAMVLVDTDGQRPVVWREQFKRHGSIAYGRYNIHRTDVNGSHAFGDIPVHRTGHWVIDGKGNISLAPGEPEVLRGGERRV